MKKASHRSSNIVIASSTVIFATIAVVCLQPNLRVAAHPSPGKLIVYGVSLYTILSIAPFAVTLLRSIWSFRKADTANFSEEQREELGEEIIVPALRGKTEPSEAEISLFQWPRFLSLGLAAAGVLCWLIELLLHRIR
jgi:hypothetical protein